MFQSYTTSNENLARCLLSLLSGDAANSSGTLPHLERFRACLRLLFARDSRLRSEALSKLMWFLANESESLRKIPLFSDLDLGALTSVLYIETPRDLMTEDSSFSVFEVNTIFYELVTVLVLPVCFCFLLQADGLRKVYEIFSSERVDDDVRRSAAEQLSVMLQGRIQTLFNFKHIHWNVCFQCFIWFNTDSSMHKIFIGFKGVEFLLEILMMALKKVDTNVIVS